jgi:uncharacterized protein (TIGR02453 family)
MAKTRDTNPFGPGLLKFLRELAANNDRAWFEANRQRYEDDVREPALAFIRIMAGHVHKISPHLTASDKKVGGSMMRIHRDIRFSKDKAPYKTNLGIQFRHDAGKDVHAPGLYFHVEPKQCFLGCGMWHPDPKALSAVRESIDEDPKGWKRVRDAKRFRDAWELGGESLKRPPRGYAEDHAFIEDLKRKDHIAFCNLSDREITAPGLVAEVVDRFRRAAPYLRWIAEAVRLDF